LESDLIKDNFDCKIIKKINVTDRDSKSSICQVVHIAQVFFHVIKKM
jgi:hypothetical protein